MFYNMFTISNLNIKTLILHLNYLGTQNNFNIMTDKSNQRLFEEFPPTPTKEWLDVVSKDLKGADFEKRLVWKTDEGFKIQPFYREEDLQKLDYLNNLPGEFPFVRGSKTDNKWLVRQDIIISDIEDANNKAKELITKGINSLGFIFKSDEIVTKENIIKLLNDISVEVELNFSAPTHKCALQTAVVEAFEELNISSKAKGSINFDPLGQLTVKKEMCGDVDTILNNIGKLTGKASSLTNFRTLSVNAKHFNNAGATAVQELAFGLSIGTEYLARLTEGGLSIDEAAKRIRFNFGVGGAYFIEIAKLRAARFLWAQIVDAYKPSDEEVSIMNIHCETSEWNKTIYDPYVNMLRTQTEAMSATLGGADSLTILPFDSIYAESSNFSERIARNQQLLLKEESYFDKIADPAAGSYYIENITDSIIDEAWKLFLEIEDKGGYLSAVKEGFIQKLVKESASAKAKNIAQRRSSLLGTNQYPNTTEFIAEAIDENKAFAKNSTDSSSIKIARGAQAFEALRLDTEKSGKRPKVFMLTYGHLAMRLARSQFAGNFFGCAGYEIIDNLGFDSPEAGVEAAVKAGADVVVLCSSDKEYAEAAPAAFKALNNRAMFVVAGAPESMDDLKAQGIEHFIHVRSNLLETLQFFNNQLIK